MKLAIALVLLAACGGDDGGSPGADAGSGSGDPFTTCTGPCATTGVTATFGANTKTFDEAYYGITASTQKIYLEVLSGGTGSCPQMNSPTEDYNLILTGITIPTDTTPQSTTSAVFDYQGDLLPNGDIHALGTSATLTPTAASDVTGPTGFIAADITATFASGTTTGHLHAIHCASFDAN